MTPKRILVFKHMPSQNPGIFREIANDQGVAFAEIDLHAGDRIPDIHGFDALWVMGGSMQIWQEDEYPWLVEEKRVIRHVVNMGMPFLGICFGHQLLAEAMGGKVEKSEHHEIGLAAVAATPIGQEHALLRDLPNPAVWVNAHTAEVVQVPNGTMVLATSARCANHVMQVGPNAFSCQFHPEVNARTVDGWMKIPGIPAALDDLLGPGGLSRFKSSIAAHLPRHNAAARQLFENWIGLAFG